MDYTPRNAVRSSLKNAFFLPWFLVGAYLGAAVAALGVLSHLRRRSTWLLVAICAAFPLGYFSFWGMHVSALTSRLSGPIYYIPVYVPLCVLMAQGFVFGARRHPRLTSVLAVAALVVTVPVGVGRLGLNRQLSRIQLAWTDATATIEGPAVVVLSPSPYLLYLNPGAGNGADLEDDIIWATDAHPSVIELIEAHPDRRAYVQRADVPTAAQLPLETTRPYEVVLPRLREGAARSGRDLESFKLVLGSLVATGPDAASVAQEREKWRRMLGFLYSTPAYWPSLELFGWQDRGEQLLAMTRENRWDRMREIIDDEMLDAFIPCGTYADIPAELERRFGGLSGYVTLMMPEDPALDTQLAAVVATLRRSRDDTPRG